MTVTTLPVAAMTLALPYGLVVGAAYLLALRLNARLYLENGPLWRPIGLMLVRLFGSVALLGAAVPWGWAPTLMALAGFGLARPLVLHWLDRRDRAAAGAAAAAAGNRGEG